MAVEDFFVPCVMMDKKTAQDGFGGVVETWTDGAPIRCGIVRKSTTEAVIAYQKGTREIFTLAFSDLLEMHQGDTVKRLSDGKTFRVTSDSRDMTTPPGSEMHFRQADAEVITL